MLWIILALSAGLLWTGVSIIDKYVIGHEYHDPIAAATIKNLIIFAIFSVATFLSATEITTDPSLIIPSLIGGICMGIAILLYYQSISRGDVSNIVPVFSVAPLFTLALGAYFLHERFPLSTYAGIVSIVFGAILLGLKDKGKRLIIDKAVLLAVAVAFFSSLKTVITKIPIDIVGAWSILFWIGGGALLVAIPLIIYNYDRIEAFQVVQTRIGLRHFIIADIFDATGHLLFLLALALGSASIITGVLHIKPLLTFFISVVMGVFFPQILREELNKRLVVKKFIATLLIVAGVTFILLQ